MSSELVAQAWKLYQSGDSQQALRFCERRLQEVPQDADAWAVTAQIAISGKSYQLAIDALKRLVGLQPKNMVALSNLASAYGVLGNYDESHKIFLKILEQAPDNPAALSNLSNCFFEMGRYEEAEEMAQRAIAVSPDQHWPYFHLANAQVDLGKYQEACRAYEQALQRDRSNVNCRKNYGLNLMRLGQFEQGLVEYEARWEADGLETPSQQYGRPQWDGRTPIEGRRFLLWGEQGLGDQIQFLRFGKLLRDRGAEVVLRLHDALVPIAATSDCFDELAGFSDEMPAFDEHCAMMSLPLALGLQVNGIPAPPYYLHAPQSRIAKWQPRLQQLGEGLKIGVSWQGNLSTKFGPSKAVELRSFRRLAALPDVCLVSLQKGVRENEIQGCGFPLVDCTAELDVDGKPFLDTAAIISQLDLVVTCDTSIAHLAAALGKPTWVLLKFAADWRWFVERSDSPWYPSVRLFRQTIRGDWESVMQRVVDACRIIGPSS